MQSVYPTPGNVSIWVGVFETEMAFDEEVDRILAPALNLPCHIADICETAHEPKPTGIRSLLTGFSGDQSFIDSAILAADHLGIFSATSAIVCYNLAVRDKVASKSLQFLGTHSGTDVLIR